MSELTNFQQVQDRIKEQVKVQFFNMLPDEAFQQLIQKEIEAFFTNEHSKWEFNRTSSYSNVTALEASVSPFRLLVWEQVRNHTAKRMKDVFESDAFKDACMSSKLEGELGDAAKSRFEALCIAMAGSFFQQVMSQAIYQTKNDVYNSISASGISLTTRF